MYSRLANIYTLNLPLKINILGLYYWASAILLLPCVSLTFVLEKYVHEFCDESHKKELQSLK